MAARYSRRRHETALNELFFVFFSSFPPPPSLQGSVIIGGALIGSRPNAFEGGLVDGR